jgi:pimeloyl-ACP methyl ester carboxylesterase
MTDAVAASLADFDTHVVDVRGAPVHFSQGGKGDHLLVLHPAGGIAPWLPYHAALARKFRVIAPDHPGFGRTPGARDIESVDDIAVLYSDLLDLLEIERIAVLGISLGGWIAAELAVLDRHRVDRLVLVNAIGLRVAGAPVADLFAMSPPQKAAALFHDQEVARLVFGGDFDLDAIMQFYRNDTAFAHLAWAPFCCNPKLRRRLHRIRARTLVLLGDQDRVVPRAHGEAYAQAIPDARIELVPDAGHALLFEKMDAGIAAVDRFLSA